MNKLPRPWKTTASLDIDSEEEFSDEPTGTIMKQEPAAETEVVPGETELVFTISKGKEPRILDNLVGYNEKELPNYEQTSGFDIDISVRHSETVPKGK